MPNHTIAGWDESSGGRARRDDVERSGEQRVSACASVLHGVPVDPGADVVVDQRPGEVRAHADADADAHGHGLPSAGIGREEQQRDREQHRQHDPREREVEVDGEIGRAPARSCRAGRATRSPRRAGGGRGRAARTPKASSRGFSTFVSVATPIPAITAPLTKSASAEKHTVDPSHRRAPPVHPDQQQGSKGSSTSRFGIE